MASAVTGQARVHSTERSTADATAWRGIALNPKRGKKSCAVSGCRVDLGDSLCLRKVQGSTGEPLAQTLTELCRNNGY